MKKNRGPLYIAFALAAVIFLWMLSGVFFRARNHVAVQQRETHLFRVRAVHSVAQKIVRESDVNARTEADRQVTLRSELDGQVLEVCAKRGSVVQEGDPIIRLEMRDREARAAQAAAALKASTMERDSARTLAAKGLQSQSELAAAEAACEAAEASLKIANLDLERATIRAPFDGVLVERYVEKGDYLNAGSQVALVADLDPIVVTGYMTGSELEGVETGGNARAELNPGGEIRGMLTYISPEADAQTRTYKVEMRSPNPGQTLRAGITAQLFVPHAEISAHFISPAHVLLSDDGTVGLLLSDAEGNTRFSPVSIVRATADGLWVSGIPDDTIIVTEGKDFVSPGQQVELVMQDDAEAVEAAK